MTVDPHAVLLADRRHWLNDLTRWQHDLSTWRQELASAIAELRRAEVALEDHRRALESYGDELQGEKDILVEFEVAVGDFESGESVPGAVTPAEMHEVRAGRHPHLWDAHERLKKYHHSVVAKITMLLKALAEPM